MMNQKTINSIKKLVDAAKQHMADKCLPSTPYVKSFADVLEDKPTSFTDLLKDKAIFRCDFTKEMLLKAMDDFTSNVCIGNLVLPELHKENEVYAANVGDAKVNINSILGLELYDLDNEPENVYALKIGKCTPLLEWSCVKDDYSVDNEMDKTIELLYNDAWTLKNQLYTKEVVLGHMMFIMLCLFKIPSINEYAIHIGVGYKNGDGLDLYLLPKHVKFNK